MCLYIFVVVDNPSIKPPSHTQRTIIAWSKRDRKILLYYKHTHTQIFFLIMAKLVRVCVCVWWWLLLFLYFASLLLILLNGIDLSLSLMIIIIIPHRKIISTYSRVNFLSISFIRCVFYSNNILNSYSAVVVVVFVFCWYVYSKRETRE